MYKKLTIMLCALSLALTGIAAAEGHDGHGNGGGPKQSDDNDRVRARLNGPAISGEKPSGTAVSRSHDGTNVFRVEVEDVNLPDGTILNVVLIHEGNRMRAGELKLMNGTGELDLRARDGDQVPKAESGDTVVVRHDQMNVLAGVFF